MKHNYTRKEMTETGIYKITCLINSKFYIGSAYCINASESKKGFLGRLNRHLYALKANKHRNRILQNSFNKYGIESFVFEIIEVCNPNECIAKEQYYLDTLQPFDPVGFNICKSSLSNNKKENFKNRTTNRDYSNANSHLKISIIQKDLNDNMINEFDGISEAARITCTQRVQIYKCCRGEAKTAGGFVWQYKYPSDFKPGRPSQKFNVKVINLSTNQTTIYKSLREASKNIDYCVSTIRIHITNKTPIENKYIVEKILL